MFMRSTASHHRLPPTLSGSMASSFRIADLHGLALGPALAPRAAQASSPAQEHRSTEAKKRKK